jgi:hypothetical protein
MIGLNNNLEILKNDIAFGTGLESPVIERLSKYFGEEVKKVEYQYSLFDAQSETTKYEIKSRRCRSDQYPTTIIGINKACPEGGRLVFVFHFTNGLYYIEYNADKFASYEIKHVEAVRKGGVRTLKPHYFIPVGDLTKINI